MTRLRVLLIASLLATVGGSVAVPGTSASVAPGRELPTYTWSSTPSPVVLLLQRRRTLKPSTYCWKSPPAPPSEDGEIGSGIVCADSFEEIPRADLKKVARTAPIRFWFGRPDWRWRATLTSFGQPKRPGCTVHSKPRRLAARRFELQPPPYLGTYRITLFGRGPEGDVVVDFSWRYGARAGRCT